MKIKSLICQRCGHEWYPRIPDPKQCPKCRSVRWYEAMNRGKNHA